MDFFLVLLVVFLLAFVFGKVAKSLGFAKVIGYIAAGLFLSSPIFGPNLFDETTKNSMDSIAGFGMLLLFFFAGLKISILQFKKNLKESFSISFLNTLLPFAVITVFAILTGLDFKTAIVLGLVLSVSAQAVIVEVLDELGLLKDKLGQLIVNAGSVDDMVELVLLSFTLGFLGFSAGTEIGLIFLNLAIFAGIIVSAKLWIIPSFFKIFAQKTSPESLFSASIAIAMLMAILSNYLGLGVIIGALVSGILVRHLLSIEQRNPWKEHVISNNIHLIGFGFFIPLFFTWIGYKTNLGVTTTHLFLILSLFLLSFFFGIFGTWLAVKLNKGTSIEGMLVALAMGTKGDVELAVGLIALKSGIISQEIFSIIVIIATISSIIPVILFKYCLKLYVEKKNPFTILPTHLT